MRERKIASRLGRTLVSALALLLFAQQPLAADLVIANARLIDGTGAPPRDGVNILLSGGRVQSVGTDEIDVKGAKVINAKGKTVLPGLTDAHVHSSMEFPVPPEEMDAGFGYPDPPSGRFTATTRFAPLWRATSARKCCGTWKAASPPSIDPGTHFPWGLEMRENLRSGKVLGPRLYITGRLFNGTGRASCLHRLQQRSLVRTVNYRGHRRPGSGPGRRAHPSRRRRGRGQDGL